MQTPPDHDGSADFDFFIGTWTVRHRRLVARLRGSTEWETFEGVTTAQKILGGAGNIDDGSLDRVSGRIHGMTVRLYHPESRQWSLHWADSVGRAFFTPMVGAFADGRGQFYAHELNDGVMVYSRFIWSDITPDSCHWEQALSADGGRTWETNWTMDFTRQG